MGEPLDRDLTANELRLVKEVCRISLNYAKVMSRVQAAQKYLADMEPTAETSELLALLSVPVEAG